MYVSCLLAKKVEVFCREKAFCLLVRRVIDFGRLYFSCLLAKKVKILAECRHYVHWPKGYRFWPRVCFLSIGQKRLSFWPSVGIMSIGQRVIDFGRVYVSCRLAKKG